MKKLFLFLLISVFSINAIPAQTKPDKRDKEPRTDSKVPANPLQSLQRQKVDTNLINIKIIYDLYKSKDAFENFVFYPKQGLRVSVKTSERDGKISVFFGNDKIDSINVVKSLGAVDVLAFLKQREEQRKLIVQIKTHKFTSGNLFLPYTNFTESSISELQNLLKKMDEQQKVMDDYQRKVKDLESAVQTLKADNADLSFENETMNKSLFAKLRLKRALKRL